MFVISRTPIVRAPLLVVASGVAFVSGSVQAFPDIFVDQNATGLDTGLSWMDAYVSLQDGLGDAGAGETVFVAKGTYKPGLLPLQSFGVPLQVVLERGYAGSNNPADPFARDFVLYETILSGDIDNNDLNSPAQNPGGHRRDQQYSRSDDSQL